MKIATVLHYFLCNKSNLFAVSPDQKSAPGNRQPKSCIPNHLNPWRHHNREAQNQATDEKQDTDGPGQEALQQDDDPQQQRSREIDERHQKGNVNGNSDTLEQSTVSQGPGDVPLMQERLGERLIVCHQRIEEPINQQTPRVGDESEQRQNQTERRDLAY